MTAVRYCRWGCTSDWPTPFVGVFTVRVIAAIRSNEALIKPGGSACSAQLLGQALTFTLVIDRSRKPACLVVVETLAIAVAVHAFGSLSTEATVSLDVRSACGGCALGVCKRETLTLAAIDDFQP